MTSSRATASASKRRIWSEFVPYETLCSERVLTALKSRDLQLLVAVTPGQIEEIAALNAVYRDAEVKLGVWPMVSDADGRWGSTFNAEIYAAFVLEVVERAPEVGTIALDLEPPIELVRGLVAAKGSAIRSLLRSDGRATGQARFVTLLNGLRSQGYECIAAVSPMLLVDDKDDCGWQWLLGTDISELPLHAASFMMYTSIFEGYSRGTVNRRAAKALLAHTGKRAHKQWGDRAALSLGATGGGALGDERPYQSLDELVEDVGIARACGIEDLALFDLSGVLGQAEPEAWLDAFVDTPPMSHNLPKSLRSRLLWQAAKGIGDGIRLLRLLK